MNAVLSDLRSTIIPRSDQLNADQLLNGPITITITGVDIHDSAEQPISLRYLDDDGRPYKPGKTMRKVIIFAWGEDGRAWIGKSMTLYNDPAVKFGSIDVGGIRISHMTDIEQEVRLSLNTARGKKGLYVIQKLQRQAAGKQPQRTDRHAHLIADFEVLAREQGFQAFHDAWVKLQKEDRLAIGITERDRIGALANDSQTVR